MEYLLSSLIAQCLDLSGGVEMDNELQTVSTANYTPQLNNSSGLMYIICQ